ncbi:Dyp-type peroxidase [Sorangium sp. So ce1000]|uniref:Dyp-type peroxidase n=1 Tax=Sorangium sp. So ce1000 TaxID=3133325 RepID=UPI003F63B4CE
MPALDLADIQAIVVRDTPMPAVRFLIAKIARAGAAMRVIGRLSHGDAGSGPRITAASPWATSPAYVLTLGFTYHGLEALGLAEHSLHSFPAAFVQGAAERAKLVGDTGDNAPRRWIGGLGTGDAHVVLALHAADSAVLESMSTELRSLFAREGAFTELSHQDGGVLPKQVEHFGYKFGIAAVRIDGGPRDRAPARSNAPTGQFILGYPSQHPGFAYPVPTPEVLGRNGSFAVYRVMRQDVDGFARALSRWAPSVGMTEEKLAAKICGRWRNGVPLVVSPDTDSPDAPIAREDLDDFDYEPHDPRGYRCPIGAHIRRVNPRSQPVAGGHSRLRLLIRRGTPYGPPYDPLAPHDGIERGLLALFICVSLRDQFEFVMSEWVESGRLAAGLRGTKDPLVGNNDPATSKFVIPSEDGDRTITGFSRFVTTRGAAYCFLPSITALKYIAGLSPA